MKRQGRIFTSLLMGGVLLAAMCGGAVAQTDDSQSPICKTPALEQKAYIDEMQQIADWAKGVSASKYNPNVPGSVNDDTGGRTQAWRDIEANAEALKQQTEACK